MLRRLELTASGSGSPQTLRQRSLGGRCLLLFGIVLLHILNLAEIATSSWFPPSWSDPRWAQSSTSNP